MAKSQGRALAEGEGDRDRSESLAERVAGTLGRRIVAGRYRPGDTLPTEPQVQEEFGVSRTAVREAVRLLAAKGMTRSRPKTGTKVLPVTDWNLLDPTVLRWHVDQAPTDAFIHSLFEMRSIIEPAAAARAAERVTPGQLAVLERAMKGIEKGPRASPQQVAADIDFHMTILEASHNPLLRSVGAAIQSALELTFSLGWRTVMENDAVIRHRAILEAIREGRSDDAFVSMRRLLRSSKGDVFDVLWDNRTEERAAGPEGDTDTENTRE